MDELVEKLSRIIIRAKLRGLATEGTAEQHQQRIDKMWPTCAGDARACLSEIESAGMVVVPRGEIDALRWRDAKSVDDNVQLSTTSRG